MRAPAALLLTGVLAAFHPVRAASEKAESPAPLIPLRIPGYELRTLDVTKSVLFQVGGSRVEVSVPIFLYYPVPGAAGAGPILRQTQAALRKLTKKSEWTAEEIQEVMGGIDQAERLLDAAAGPGEPSPAQKAGP